MESLVYQVCLHSAPEDVARMVVTDWVLMWLLPFILWLIFWCLHDSSLCLLESVIQSSRFAHYRGSRNSLEIVRIRTIQPPGKSQSARWPNYKRGILTSNSFLSKLSSILHTYLKISLVTRCLLTFVIPLEWSHPLEVRSEKTKMLRIEKLIDLLREDPDII